MEIVDISYQEFKQYKSLKSGLVSYRDDYSTVLNFYLKQRQSDTNKSNQKKIYLINDVVDTEKGERIISTESIETKETYARFGIYFKSLELERDMTVSMDNSNREYIIFIDRTPNNLDEDFIRSNASVYVKSYLPEGAIPTWFIDLNNHTTYNTVKFVLDTLRSIYPKIDSLVMYNNLVKSALRDESLNEDIAEEVQEIERYYIHKAEVSKGKFEFNGIELVDITKTVDLIRERFESSNDGTVELFITELDKIGQDVNDYKLYVYYGIFDDDYILAACYLTYFYKANCFIHSSLENRFFAQLMDMFYNPNIMLVEDRIKYLLNFPTFTLTRTDYTAGYVGTRTRKVYGKLQLCPIQVDLTTPFSNGIIDPKSVITVDNVDFSTVEILPLLDHFKLDSADINECRIEEAALRRLFIEFEEAIVLPKESLIDVTNTFFINFNGEVCIAHLEKLNLETDSHIVADSMTTGTSTSPKVSGATNKLYKLNAEQIEKYIPLEVFHCADEGKSKLILGNEYFYPVKIQKKLGLDPVIPLKVVEPYKCTSKAMLPLVHYSVNRLNIPLKVDEAKYFHDIGMYAITCSAYRTGGSYKLLSELVRSEARRQSNLFSAYGGFHESVSTPLTVTEHMLAKYTTEHEI